MSSQCLNAQIREQLYALRDLVEALRVNIEAREAAAPKPLFRSKLPIHRSRDAYRERARMWKEMCFAWRKVWQKQGKGLRATEKMHRDVVAMTQEEID